MRSGRFTIRLASQKRSPRRGETGFTLVELMIVITIVMILASMAAVRYEKSVQRAREATLKTDLFTMRQAIPGISSINSGSSSLDDLVREIHFSGSHDRLRATRIGTRILKIYCCLRSRLRLVLDRCAFVFQRHVAVRKTLAYNTW